MPDIAKLAICLLLVPLLGWQGGVSAAEDLTRQREQFVAAEKALKQGQRARFKRLAASLSDYPLYPYLLYRDLRDRLTSASAEEMDAFLIAFGDTPPGRRLHRAWLRELVKRRDWEAFLHAYRAGLNDRLDCYYRRALLETGDRERGFANMDQLWLTGRSLPKACDYTLERWRAAGHQTTELVWQRIRLAMTDNQLRLSRYLGGFLAKNERRWVDTWQRVHREPEQLLDTRLHLERHRAARWIVVHGLKRLARRDPEKAVQAWDHVRADQYLTLAEQGEVVRAIGLTLARRNQPGALQWLSLVPATQADEYVRSWRVRAALAEQDWDAVLYWIERLHEDDRDAERWQYWKARALEASGERQHASRLFQQVARSRSFEGFLAADRLNLPYAFEDRPLQFSPVALQNMESDDGIARARELYRLERMLDARREWYAATRYMDREDLRLAAAVAHRWGWHDRAIITLGRSGYRDDLRLRFPVLFAQTVIRESEQARIDPAWILAVIRRESAFHPEARSHAGALGLMQLMPATARHVARTLKTRLRRTGQLLQADLNIRFGTTYLRMMLDRFDDHPVLTTAAYNAGQHRVRRWLPQDRSLPADIWIETVPFTETRNYLRNVFAYTAIYEKRLGREPTRLSQRLQPVEPARLL